MLKQMLSGASLGALALLAPLACDVSFAQEMPLAGDYERDGQIRHVLLISIDGMHAIDFANCVKGGYCKNLAELRETGLNFTAASTSKPSDSFPGLTALVTGGSPKSTGAFYDVSYDRALSPPAKTNAVSGIPGGACLCPSVVGTHIGMDE